MIVITMRPSQYRLMVHLQSTLWACTEYDTNPREYLHNAARNLIRL